MNRYRAWLLHLPLGGYFVFVFVLWTGIQMLVEIGDGNVLPRLIGNSVGGLVFAGLLTTLIAYRRRRVGGTSELYEMTEAVRTGKLPETAEPSTWRPELERRRRSFSRNRWLSPVLVIVMVLMGVAFMVLGAALWGAIIAVLFLGLGVFSVWQNAKYLRHVVSLQEQLSSLGNYQPHPVG